MEKRIVHVLEDEEGNFLMVKSAIPQIGWTSKLGVDTIIPDDEKENTIVRVYKFNRDE